MADKPHFPRPHGSLHWRPEGNVLTQDLVLHSGYSPPTERISHYLQPLQLPHILCGGPAYTGLARISLTFVLGVNRAGMGPWEGLRVGAWRCGSPVVMTAPLLAACMQELCELSVGMED